MDREQMDFDYTEVAEYVNSELPPERMDEVERRLFSQTDDFLAAKKLRRLWPNVWNVDHPPTDTKAISANVLARISVNRDGPAMFTSRINRTWRYAAASFLVGVIGLFAGWILSTGEGKQKPSLQLGESPFVYTTANGQRATVMLPDGTTVVLNVASRVEIPIDYSSGNRRIRLNGEALFTVVHHENNPLRVFAGRLETRVLGTQFSVRAYDDDRYIQVVVADGKVAAHLAGKKTGEITVVRNEMALLNDQSDKIAKHQIEPDTYFSWTQGRLEYLNASVFTVVGDLQRLYGIEIRIASQRLASQLITGKFEQTMSPRGSVSLLAQILAGEVKENGNIFYVSERE